jgi:pimeloyl-ACP methyl ester carboxylesterase
MSSSAESNRWIWQGHSIYTQVSGPKPFFLEKSKPAVLLIHGFGCSTTYWRATTSALTQAGYQVHALDLLGQGQSAKPGRNEGVEYSINLWAEMVDDYVKENIGREVVMMGNSLGSVVALSAATGDFGGGYISTNELSSGLCLFNCGIGMNSQGVIDEPQWNPAQRLLLKSLFAILNTLVFGNQPLLSYVLDEVVTRDFLRKALTNLYLTTPERVDDELVESFYLPAKEEGAVDALSQIYTNDPGKTPQQIYADNIDAISNIPIQVIWGEGDVVAPLGGPVGQFFVNLAQNSDSKVSFEMIPDCGHVPFDDNPELSNGVMISWLENIVQARNGANIQPGNVLEGLRALFGR